uniref:Uncharacterized protein n=1 Tax=Salix viminalis TaxID=40686 RepID=A0A6N2MIZ9_SALVM
MPTSEKRKHLLKQWALSVLAAIARSSQDRFLDYYRTVMPYLNFVVQLLASTPISNLDIHDPMRIQGLKVWKLDLLA